MKINFIGFGHINIVVDNIRKASEYYKKLFGAVEQQEFPKFINIGFSKSAGFLEEPEKVEVMIRYLEIPKTNLFLELQNSQRWLIFSKKSPIRIPIFFINHGFEKPLAYPFHKADLPCSL
jgi:hypothetical protein